MPGKTAEFNFFSIASFAFATINPPRGPRNVLCVDSLEEAIAAILQKIRAAGEREIEARQVGEWVMEQLYRLDHVAYVRFASVYKRFKDISEFRETIDQMNGGS